MNSSITYREIVYFVIDELKLISDDSTFTPEHIIFLADKMRAKLLYERYKDAKKGDPARSNYQTINFKLIQVPAIAGTNCSGTYLRTNIKLPTLLHIGIPRIYSADCFKNEQFTLVPIERMPFVGNNKWLENFIYIAKGPDDYLYLKSSNPQFLYLKDLNVNAIFQDSKSATELCSCNEKECDILDRQFPLEETLVHTLIYNIVSELSGVRYQPTDRVNNAKDDMEKYGVSAKENKE